MIASCVAVSRAQIIQTQCQAHADAQKYGGFKEKCETCLKQFRKKNPLTQLLAFILNFNQKQQGNTETKLRHRIYYVSGHLETVISLIHCETTKKKKFEDQEEISSYSKS